MIQKTVKVVNHAGIHCRPSSLIITEAEKYPNCKFLVACEKIADLFALDFDFPPLS